MEAAITDRAMGVVPSEKHRRMAGYGSYERMVDVLEAAVASGPFIAGDRFTAADVYVGAQVIWGQQFGTLPARPAFADYARRLMDRGPCRRGAALDDEAMAAATA